MKFSIHVPNLMIQNSFVFFENKSYIIVANLVKCYIDKSYYMQSYCFKLKNIKVVNKIKRWSKHLNKAMLIILSQICIFDYLDNFNP